MSVLLLGGKIDRLIDLFLARSFLISLLLLSVHQLPVQKWVSLFKSQHALLLLLLLLFQLLFKLLS